MTDNIWLFHVDDIGQGKREHIFPNELCPNSHLKAPDFMEGTLEARELDGDCGRDQLIVKVRGHVYGLSGDHGLLQTVRSIHHYVCKQKKYQKIYLIKNS